MKIIFMILTLFIFNNCGSIKVREREEPAIYKGYYIGGSEVRSYRLDGSEEILWVLDDTSEIEKDYKSFNLKSNEEVYLEVEGIIRPNDTPGDISEDYENLIEIHRVIKITPLVN